MKNDKPESRALAPLPAADEQIAHSRSVLLEEQAARRSEICRRIGDIRQIIDVMAVQTVTTINNVREVGLIIMQEIERLPGKQLTLDFFQQQQQFYIDPQGRPITLENLKWCVRVADHHREAITDLTVARSYQKEMFNMIGFVLAGDAPGRTAAPAQNHYAVMICRLPSMGRELAEHVKSLEQNSKFGPIDQWQPVQAKMMLEKVEPVLKVLEDMAAKLRGASKSTVLE